MTDEGQRSTIEPNDWPLEESTTGENSHGLRSDQGASSEPPAAAESDAIRAGRDGGRGETGTRTPGERGTDQGPR
jgi:hypothetical protein